MKVHVFDGTTLRSPTEDEAEGVKQGRHWKHGPQAVYVHDSGTTTWKVKSSDYRNG